MTDSPSAPATAPNVLDLVRRWERDGLITAEQAEAILAREGWGTSEAPLGPRTPVSGGGANRLVEALGYLGGALAVTAAVVLVLISWQDLGEAARVAIPLVSAAGLFAAGTFVPGTMESPGSVDDGRRRLRSVLWLAGLAAFAVFVAVLGDQTLSWDGETTALVVGLTSAALGGLLYARTRATAQQLGVFGGLSLTAAMLGVRSDWETPFVVGLAVWTVAVAWFVLGERDLLPPPPLATYLGAATAIAAALLAGQDLPGHLLGIGTVLALFAWGVVRDNVGYLAIAALGTLGVVPGAVTEFFPDSEVAAPVGLLVIAGVLVFTAVTVARRRSQPR